MDNSDLENEYLRRVYIALDGMWYIMAEKHFGFENALKLDKEVWVIMAKIGARKIKELARLREGELESLSASLAFRFAVEGYEIRINQVDGRMLLIEMTSCPWRKEIIKSKNEKLLLKVAEQICPRVYETWGREFFDQFEFEMSPQICRGGEICRLKFIV